MNPLTLLLPVLLGVALVYAALTGHLTQEQLAAGGLLLLAPGADRFGPLLRQLLRPGSAEPPLYVVTAWDSVTDKQRECLLLDNLAQAEAEARQLSAIYGAERVVLASRGISRAPLSSSTPIPPSLPPAALLLLLALLALAPSCASWPAWRAALAACGVQVAPAGVQSGVALALHKGEGWAEALGELVSIYGGCLVKAQVQAHAEGAGSDPPHAQAETAPLASLIGGELSAAPSSAVTRAEAQQRAAAWLRGHR